MGVNGSVVWWSTAALAPVTVAAAGWTAGHSVLAATGLAATGALLSAVTAHGWTRRRLLGPSSVADLKRLLQLERDSSEGLCLSAIEALASAVEAKSGDNLGHLARVHAYSFAISRAMNVDHETVQAIRVASLTHEIGRLGVPETILAKAGALTEEERERIRVYPVLGARVLSTVPFPWPVVPVVQHHRELWNGAGYPDQLQGENIPLGARILAVADCYDTLVSNRSYRSSHSHEEAMAEIKARAGLDFDPAVVTALTSVVDAVNARLKAPENVLGDVRASVEIAAAQQEAEALHDLATAVGATLDLEIALEALARRIRATVPFTSCAIYLLEDDRKTLHAYGAFGANIHYLMHSRAKLRESLTGKVVLDGVGVRAPFREDRLWLSPAAEPWQPLRSSLIVPLRADGRSIGTINLHSEKPDGFRAEDLRVMAVIGDLAGRAVENARLFAQTRETAFTDPLTGLRNSRYLRHFLDQEINRAHTNVHPIAVLGLDLDGFKLVNDTYGHEMGDRILREVAQLLQAQIRSYDMLARCGGDEFVLVLPETERIEADLVAEKIRRAAVRYATDKVSANADFPQLGVSVGVAMFPEDAPSAAGLLAHADGRMYEQKRSRYATIRVA